MVSPDISSLSLEAPQVYLFHGENYAKAVELNKLAFDFKFAPIRDEFARDPEGLMARYRLPEAHRRLLRDRNWTALVAAGGHHWTIMKIAFGVGQSHLHIGAHMAGRAWEDVAREGPHDIDLMPEAFR